MAELQKLNIICPSCNHEFRTYLYSRKSAENVGPEELVGRAELAEQAGFAEPLRLAEKAESPEPTKRDLISTEFRPYFVGIKPLHFEIHTCPFCGSTGSIDQFVGSTVPPVEDDLRAFLLDHILPMLKQDLSWMSFSGERFEFLAMIMEYQGAEPQKIGLLYLKAAWCASDLFHKKERQYRMRAAEFFQKALSGVSGGSSDSGGFSESNGSSDFSEPSESNGSSDFGEPSESSESDGSGESGGRTVLPPARQALLKYMIGEQYRRVGNLAEAAEWYDQVQSLAGADSLLAALAEQQKTNPQVHLSEEQRVISEEISNWVRVDVGIKTG